MQIESFAAWCIYALYIPFCVIGLILAHYALRRFLWRRRVRLGKGSVGYYPSALALSMAIQFIQVYHRPSMAYVVEARQQAHEDADEDDNGDPESPAARRMHFLRQLRRIRRGDPVDRLVWRL